MRVSFGSILKPTLLLFTLIILFFTALYCSFIDKVIASESNWFSIQRDEQNTGYNSDEATLTPPLQSTWRLTLDSSVGSNPVVSNGNIYITSSVGTIYSINTKDGSTNWTSKSTGRGGEILFSENVLYVANICRTSTCSLDAYNATDGTRLWTTTPFQSGVLDMKLSGNHIYIGNTENILRAIEKYDGNIIWEQQLAAPTYVTPSVLNNVVYMVDLNRTAYAINPINGEVLWSNQFSTGPSASPPTVIGNKIHTGSRNEGVYALDILSGDIDWNNKTPRWVDTAISYAKGILYTRSQHGTVYAINSTTGDIIWHQDTPSISNIKSSVSLANGVAYVGSNTGHIYALDSNSGIIIWSEKAGSVVWTPTIAEGKLFITTSNELIAYTTDTSTPSSPQTLNVTDFKQYEDPWGDTEYDHANNWSSNPYMSRWGCAVTSAAMVLDHYGHNTDPGSLNSWLKTQKDGYTRNGGVMWPAISRITRLNPQPTLEFAYIGYTDDKLTSEIESKRPAILKLDNKFGGNHFLVGKGINNGDFDINDPGTTKPLLSEANAYWGSSINIGQFTPTNTDLSYIAAFIDENDSVRLLKDGNDIGDEFYHTEYPYIDPETSTADEGETLNSVWYPKPDEGSYSFEVTGDGFYRLDIYYYDENGNVTMETIYGYLLPDETHTYPFNFDPVDTSDTTANDFNEQEFADRMELFCEYRLIKTKGICRSINRLLSNAVKLKERNKYLPSNVLVDVVIDRINFFTPNRIDPELSKYLLTIVEGLRTTPQ